MILKDFKKITGGVKKYAYCTVADPGCGNPGDESLINPRI